MIQIPNGICIALLYQEVIDIEDFGEQVAGTAVGDRVALRAGVGHHGAGEHLRADQFLDLTVEGIEKLRTEFGHAAADDDGFGV